MARKRDIVVAVIITCTFLIAFGFFALMLVGLSSDTEEFSFSGLGGSVGVIEVFGIINEPSGRQVIRQLDRWADRSSIEALVLHINSPGGGVSISQEIYDAIGRFRAEGKPVVASMASVAASGGYYIACAADMIVANPGTLTGSIGVIMQYPVAEKLLDKIGIEYQTIKSGELKDVGDFSRKATEKERLMLRSLVMDSYEQFVDAIATGRGKDKEEIYPVADGSIFTGQQAFNLGLVDELAGLKEAIDLAAELAGMDADPDVIRPYRREKRGLIDLFGRLVGQVSTTLETNVSGPQLLYLYQ